MEADLEVPRLPTRVAHAGWDRQDFHGWSVFEELKGATFTELVVLAISGRRPTPREVELIDALIVSATVADPRIWPLKIARLVSAYGSAWPGVAASYAWQADAAVGAATGASAARLLQELVAQVPEGDDEGLRAFLKRRPRGRGLPGFGVPFRPRDERLDALAERLRELGHEGPYWSRVLEVRTISEEIGLEPNLALGTAALFLDLGFDVTAIGHLGMVALHAAYLANAVEGAVQAPELLQHLPDAYVRYVGPAPRQSPRAHAAAAGSVAPPAPPALEPERSRNE